MVSLACDLVLRGLFFGIYIAVLTKFLRDWRIADSIISPLFGISPDWESAASASLVPDFVTPPTSPHDWFGRTLFGDADDFPTCTNPFLRHKKTSGDSRMMDEMETPDNNGENILSLGSRFALSGVPAGSYLRHLFPFFYRDFGLVAALVLGFLAWARLALMCLCFFRYTNVTLATTASQKRLVFELGSFVLLWAFSPSVERIASVIGLIAEWPSVVVVVSYVPGFLRSAISWIWSVVNERWIVLRVLLYCSFLRLRKKGLWPEPGSEEELAERTPDYLRNANDEVPILSRVVDLTLLLGILVVVIGCGNLGSVGRRFFVHFNEGLAVWTSLMPIQTVPEENSCFVEDLLWQWIAYSGFMVLLRHLGCVFRRWGLFATFFRIAQRPGYCFGVFILSSWTAYSVSLLFWDWWPTIFILANLFYTVMMVVVICVWNVSDADNLGENESRRVGMRMIGMVVGVLVLLFILWRVRVGLVSSVLSVVGLLSSFCNLWTMFLKLPPPIVVPPPTAPPVPNGAQQGGEQQPQQQQPGFWQGFQDPQQQPPRRRPQATLPEMVEEVEGEFSEDELGVIDVPAYYKCPITRTIMRNPVTTTAGHTYERLAIEEALKRRSVDPLTNIPQEGPLIMNWNLKSTIEDWRKKERSCLREKEEKRLVQELMATTPSSPVSPDAEVWSSWYTAAAAAPSSSVGFGVGGGGSNTETTLQDEKDDGNRLESIHHQEESDTVSDEDDEEERGNE